LELHPTPPSLGEFVLVFGDVGAAPGHVTVIGVDLDREEPALAGTTARDGSFLLELPGREGDVLRLHTEEDGRRSEPIDVLAALGPPTRVEPLAPCLRLPLALELPAVLELVNDCDEDAVIDAVRLRAPSAIVLEDASPFVVPPGETARIALSASSAADEVVLIELSAPAAERRAVSVRAR
jgi:hypothetical protein